MVYRQEEMERSKPLHNFQMTNLKWGTRRILECRKVNLNGEPIPSSSSDRNLVVGRRLSGNRVEPEFERGGSSDRVKASVGRLIPDLHTKADRMMGILMEGLEKEERGKIPQSPTTDGDAMKPWNLRTRRGACNKEPMNGVNGEGSLNVDFLGKPNNLSSRSPLNSGGDAGGETSGGKKRKRAEFSVTLSRSEIEQDFMAMTGHRLPRRPNKKRPRDVRKILENLSPAMWLTEVRPDHYKVPDVPDNGKIKYFE